MRYHQYILLGHKRPRHIQLHGGTRSSLAWPGIIFIPATFTSIHTVFAGDQPPSLLYNIPGVALDGSTTGTLGRDGSGGSLGGRKGQEPQTPASLTSTTRPLNDTYRCVPNPIPKIHVHAVILRVSVRRVTFVVEPQASEVLKRRRAAQIIGVPPIAYR